MTGQTRSTPRDSNRCDRGASLVEFALLVPLLFSLLLGMITGGLALSAKNSMTNAIREGARLGATLPADGDDASTDDDGVLGWDGWAVHVKDRVITLAGGDLEADEVCVLIEAVGGSELGAWPAGTPSPCPLSASLKPATPNSAPSGTCIVKVWAERRATLNALFFSRTLTLDGKAVGRYERTSECPSAP